MKILFLAANPPGTARLDLDKEVSKIEDGLQRSKLRDQFQLVSKWAVDSNSLRRALLEETPDIVHFSGHGEGQTGLVLVGQDEKPKPATAEALSGLFMLFPQIKCVLLNACYAEAQAKAIVQHIDYVIGMRQAVRDDAAIAFATGFYDGLGYGKSIDIAFELGRNAIQFELASFSSTTRSRKLIPVDFEKVEPLPDYLIPVLLKRETGFTGSSTNLNLSSVEATSLSEKLRSNDDISKTDALKTYRRRVQEFLADLKLTQLEKFQLAILANVLGLSEVDANRILQEELEKQQNNAQSSVTNRQSQFTKIGNAKNCLFACGAALLIGLAGFLIYRQTTSINPKPWPPEYSPSSTSLTIHDLKLQIKENNCKTDVDNKVRKLDQQILFVMKSINPSSLSRFKKLNIEFHENNSFPFLQSAAVIALEKAINKRGKRLIIISAYRSIVRQQILYDLLGEQQCGFGIPIARPGQSNHQKGLAIHIEDKDGWKPFLESEGWQWLGPADPYHFDFVGGGTEDIGSLPILAFQKLWNLNHPEDKIPEDGEYTPETEKRLNQSPIEGFPKGDRIAD